MARKEALIIGAGPAGLTAAFELVDRTNIRPVVLSRSRYIGGLSRTVCYTNNRMGRVDKSNIWQLNTEMDYHESKANN